MHACERGVCACVHGYMHVCRESVLTYVCIWGDQRPMSGLPAPLSTLFFESDSLTDLELAVRSD